MFFVKRKVGDSFGVVDTDDNVEEFYTKGQLQRLVKRGISIQGTGYVKGKFIVNPCHLVLNKQDCAKNKLLTGTTSGFKGFDIHVRGNSFVADTLKEEFFDEYKDIDGGFVFVVPEVVTSLEDNFFRSASHTQSIGYRCKFCVVLPEGLEVIGHNALDSWLLDTVVFRGTIDRVLNGFVSCTLNLSSNDLPDGVFHVKVIEHFGLRLINLNNLYLPDIEFMDDGAICLNNIKNTSIHLGNNIRLLNSIVNTRYVLGDAGLFTESKTLMTLANIIYIDDNSKLERVRLEDSCGDTQSGKYVNSYIFVMSSTYYEKFERLDKSIKGYVCAGVVTYSSDEDKEFLQENLVYFCQHYKQYFSTYLTTEDYGRFKQLALMTK